MWGFCAVYITGHTSARKEGNKALRGNESRDWKVKKTQTFAWHLQGNITYLIGGKEMANLGKEKDAAMVEIKEWKKKQENIKPD